MNKSLEYIDLIGPEPGTSDYRDKQRWDKWMAWHRRFAKHFPGSNGVIAADGLVEYDRPLLSEVTKNNRSLPRNKWGIVRRKGWKA